MTTVNEKPDLNTIPYDAPLSFPAPSQWWITMQNHKGSKGTTLSVPPADLTGKNVLITGGNNGIGLEAAMQMAEWGANVYIGCRPNTPPHETQPDGAVAQCKQKAEQAGKKIEAQWWPVDMASVESALAFAKRWNESDKPLVSAILGRTERTLIKTRISSATTPAWDHPQAAARSFEPKTASRSYIKSTSSPTSLSP